ncbi:MAG TPA: hypothetical protein VHY36_11365 [Steroidobacteraceae bacterium]|jgi:hypothetical protein|nr:hypothetical protein [Steroidobacteraceae bacterium]
MALAAALRSAWRRALGSIPSATSLGWSDEELLKLLQAIPRNDPLFSITAIAALQLATFPYIRRCARWLMCRRRPPRTGSVCLGC